MFWASAGRLSGATVAQPKPSPALQRDEQLDTRLKNIIIGRPRSSFNRPESVKELFFGGFGPIAVNVRTQSTEDVNGT